MKYYYYVNYQVLESPQKIRMLDQFRVTGEKPTRDLVQIVHATNLRMSPRMAKELWYAGDTYFPPLWVAPNGEYRQPATIIMLKSNPIVVDTHIRQELDKNYQTAEYIALLETGLHDVEVFALRGSPPRNVKLIGVFKRVNIHDH
jgi:hypothetical protein